MKRFLYDYYSVTIVDNTFKTKNEQKQKAIEKAKKNVSLKIKTSFWRAKFLNRVENLLVFQVRRKRLNTIERVKNAD
jgi:hypothetical protein